MKKIIASIAFVFYFGVTSGIIVNYHYCMNRLNSTQLFVAETKTCGKCGMHTGAEGCCKDEVKIVKMKIDQKTTSSVSFELPALEVLVTLPSSFIAASFMNVDPVNHYSNHTPPLLACQETYLDNCVFRI